MTPKHDAHFVNKIPRAIQVTETIVSNVEKNLKNIADEIILCSIFHRVSLPEAIVTTYMCPVAVVEGLKLHDLEISKASL